MLPPPDAAVPDLELTRSVEDYIGRSPLRLGIMCTIGPLRFMPFLAKLRMDFPGLKLAIAEGTPARLGAQLDAGALDLAVMARPEGFPPRWTAVPLYRERFVVGLPVGHPLGNGGAVRLEDLHGHDYVSRGSCEFAGHFDGLLADRGIILNVVFESEREEWAQTMVVAGVGIACMPEFSPLLPGLVTRPIVEPEVVREIALVAPAGRAPAPPAQTFTKAIARHDWAL